MLASLADSLSSLAALTRYEFLLALRRKRSFLYAAFPPLLLLWMVYESWPAYRNLLLEADRLSNTIMSMTYYFVLAAIFLVLPGVSAGAIIGEKQRGTFDMTFLTLASPSMLILRKAAASMGIFLLIFIAVLPFFAVVFFLVGVDLTVFMMIIMSLVHAALAITLMGIFSSCYAKSLTRATSNAYGLAILWAVLVPMLIRALGILIPSPFYFPIIYSTRFVPGKNWLYFAVEVLFLLALFYASVLKLRRSPSPEAAAHSPAVSGPELKTRRRRAPYYLVDPRKKKRGFGDRFNPVLERDLRWTIMGNATSYIRSFYPVFFLLVPAAIVGVMVSFSPADQEDLSNFCSTMTLIFIIALCLMIPTYTAGLFARERESETLEMLIMTAMPPYEIVRGKLLASLAAIAPGVLLVVVLTVPGVIAVGMDLEGWLQAIRGYVTMAVCVFLVSNVSLYASLRSEKTTSAAAKSMLLGAGALIGLMLFVIVLLSWMGHGQPGKSYSVFSPIVSFAIIAYDPRPKLGEHVLFWISQVSFALLGLAFFWRTTRRLARVSTQGLRGGQNT